MSCYSSVREIRMRTAHAKIMRVQGNGADPAKLLSEVENLTEMALRMDFRGIRTGLQRLVPEFQQNGEAERVSRYAGSFADVSG